MVQNKTSNSYRKIINNAASCPLFHKTANFYGSNFEESACNAGVQSLGWEDPPGEGNGYPLQYS